MTNKLNPWLKDMLAKTRSPKFISLIIELEELEPGAIEKVDFMLTSMKLQPAESLFNMIRVSVPFGSVEAIAKIPGVRKVSYDAPTHIRSGLSILDPLLGSVYISKVTIPYTPAEMLKFLPNNIEGLLTLPFNIGRRALKINSPLPSLFSKAEERVHITPTGVTMDFIGMPADNKVNNVKQ